MLPVGPANRLAQRQLSGVCAGPCAGLTLEPDRPSQAAGRARPADAKSTRSILSEALRGSSTDAWKAQLHTRYEQDNEGLYPGGVRQPLLCCATVHMSVHAQLVGP